MKSDLIFVFENLSKKNFIVQKKVALSDFNSKMGIAGKLKAVNLFQYVIRVESFVKTVVYE